MRYTVSPQVHYQNLDDEVVLLDGRSDRYLGLNRSGALIWTILAKGGSEEDAARALEEKYGIAPERSADDVSQMVLELVENGLIEPATL